MAYGSSWKRIEAYVTVTMSTPLNVDPSLPYTWRQSLSDVELFLPIPPGTRAKQLNIAITPNTLRVALASDSSHPLLEGSFHKQVKEEESTWTVIDQKEVHIVLEKMKKQEWWKCVLQGHPEIDTAKIEPENSKLSDLDGETRAMVEKMMFDQQMKAMGKPTSEERKQQEMLAKLKAANPELDFSNAKFTS